MVPQVRIELTTYRLQGGCSASELQGQCYFYLTATIIVLTDLESQSSRRSFIWLQY